MAKPILSGFPLKKSSEVDVLKPLKNLILSRYQSSEQETYCTAINEFSKFRNNAVCRTLDVHENSLETLYGYYDQLNALETKIPTNELQISFKWKDAFDKGSIFGNKISLSLSSLAYEKVCVLFNIGALQTQIASAQPCNSDHSLKLAAKLFQSAAGIFDHMKTIVHSSLGQEPTPDLQPDTLASLSSISVAQAQEIFVVKSITDGMKPGIIAKLCAQCADNYTEAFDRMMESTLGSNWDGNWICRVEGKKLGYDALAYYYQSRVCNASKSVGEEIARLKYAIEKFKLAQTKSGISTLFADDIARSQQFLTEAVKDNDFIYHERIPNISNVGPIGRAPVAKTTAMPATFSSSFTDLFSSLVPVAVQQALTQYDLRKQEIINTNVTKLRDNTQLLNSVLASLNLPAAIEDTSGQKLPNSLREKALSIGDKGGVKNLNKMLEELPDLLKRNKEILEESERMLNEERDSDNQLRTQFKDKWTRTASDQLTSTFKINMDKYKKIIETAIEADATIRSKFSAHEEGIILLSRGPEAIAGSLPSVTSSASTSSPVVAQLKQLIEKVETIKAERDVIESDLKGAETDMSVTFLHSLAQDGVINEPVMSVESLGRVYSPLQKQVTESLSSQESLVSDIQKAHLEFSGAATGSGSERESLQKKLASAHDAFIELHGNLLEGTLFYNNLTQMLVSFQTKISDFCFARKTEKDELMKDLTQGIAKDGVATVPDIPTHHQEVTASRTAPPRPPPPQTSVQPAAQYMPPGVSPYTHTGNLPYPVNPQGMPTPMGYNYPVYTPMPQGFNPYFAQQAAQPPPPPYSGYPNQPYPRFPPQQWPPTS